VNCALCGGVRPLVKSHVIPESFFRELRIGGEPPLLVSSGEFPRRAPVGVYDRILCAPCEGRFADLDAVGAELPLQRFELTFQPVTFNGVTVGYEAAQIDAQRLLQFLVSVMWRASVSNLPSPTRNK
jgi:hypothetical protein